MKWTTRRVVVAATLAVAVAGIVVGTSIAAFPTDNVKLYTGCLTSGGTIVSVAEGNSPKQACGSGQVVKLSGGDITKITAGTGVTVTPTGGANGEVTVAVDSAHSLPQNCTSGQVAKSDGSNAWACANDTDTNTTYSAGHGLDLTGTTFSIESDNLVSNDQTCAAGKFATGINGSGVLTCADLPAGTQPAWYLDLDHNNQVGHLGRATETMVTLDLPAGKYALEGSAFGHSTDDDPQAFSCTLVSPATIFSTGGNGGGTVTDPHTFAPQGHEVALVGGVTTLAAPGQVRVDCNAFEAFFDTKLTALTIQ